MSRCPKTIHAGPGHQSEHQCVMDGTHHHHQSEDIGYYYQWSDCHYQTVEWSDEPVVFSGFMNESPGYCEVHDPISGEPL